MKNKNKLSLKIRLKIVKDKKTIVDTTRSMKTLKGTFRRQVNSVRRKIHNVIGKNNGDSYYIKVTYGRGTTHFAKSTEISNEAEFTRKTELTRVLSMFTSLDEIKDFLENYV